MASSRGPLPADPTEDERELLISVAARLNRMSTILLSSLEVPLTFRQYRTLTRVVGGATSPSQLAAIGNLSLPTVSENIDVLVRRGLMRTTQSTADRRAVVLHVTDAGQRAAEAGSKAIGDFAEALLSPLSPESRQELRASLQQVYDSATSYLHDLLGRAER
jgi:DNA-binding MarR family transcriptional regulator